MPVENGTCGIGPRRWEVDVHIGHVLRTATFDGEHETAAAGPRRQACSVDYAGVLRSVLDEAPTLRHDDLHCRGASGLFAIWRAVTNQTLTQG